MNQDKVRDVRASSGRKTTEDADGWDPTRLPDAHGKTFIVTGGNSGIGYFIGEQLASAGATVVLAARDQRKADLAIQAIHARFPQADVRFHSLDLSELALAKVSGDRLSEYDRIDGLILNAASLTLKERRLTPDGHEWVLGTNYFGNAQFVAAALPHLVATSDTRIVTMGSISYRLGHIDIDNLDSVAGRYKGFHTYATSKLAEMLFAIELDRRLHRANLNMTSLMAHPGGALDGLTDDRPPAFTFSKKDRLKAIPLRLFSQSKEKAAWPAVRAVLDPTAKGGQLWGPGSATGRRPPELDVLAGSLLDDHLAADLWDHTQALLNLSWEF